MTQSTSEYHGVVCLLRSTPDQPTIQSIAQDVAAIQFPDAQYDYQLTNELPDGIPEYEMNQHSRRKQALTDDSIYLLVYPVGDNSTPKD